jgi:arylsulfate sulfotransferase
MKIRSVSIIASGIVGVVIVIAGVLLISSHVARATEADDTTIRINGYAAGATPFISNMSLTASNTTVLKSIQFKIVPKPGSFSRPLSGTYANYYLIDRGFENQQTGEITLPVYGLYDGYGNTVTLTYGFMDGSSKQANFRITTASFNDPCGYKNPTFLQYRTSPSLSYDYFMVKGACSDFSPAIVDSDGVLRWVGTSGFSSNTAGFFDNGAYIPNGSQLYRNELDGAVTLIGDYSGNGISYFHHNIDPGKVGLLLDANTPSYYESTVIEVDPYSGNLLKTWSLGDIISTAMRAGGDDPSQFVYPAPNDWFHNNSAAYNRADDSVIVSSRENFLICLDYETGSIKWILGDPTKKWYQFPSLRQYALTLEPGSLPPIGQHAISVTFDQNILVFDNGQNSTFEVPAGTQRNYSSPRKYKLDLNAKTATEVWNFDLGQSLWCPFCGSIYEDAPFNYVIDFTFIDGVTNNSLSQWIGLNSAGDTVFRYQYQSAPGCVVAFNAFPLHLENTKFPAVGPRLLNLSTRGSVASGDNVLINGFIVSGTDSETVVVRALGPSLSGLGVSGALADPVLSLYDSSGTLLATNDNWQTDVGATFMEQNGLAPPNPVESGHLQTNLAPGAYTVVVTGKNGTQGISLAEVYEVPSPGLSSELGNVSGRGFVGTGDNVLIGGFIIGDVGSGTVIVRALGPSLGSFGVSNPLGDPVLMIYDSKGALIATNDNWQDDIHSDDVQHNGLAPSNALESAIVLRLPSGAYTAIVSGANGVTGNALVEVYHLE